MPLVVFSHPHPINYTSKPKQRRPSTHPSQAHPISTPSQSSFIIHLPLPKSISQTPTNNISQTQPHRRAAHQPSGAEFTPESLLPPARENEVRGAPGGRQARAVGFEAVDVQVGAEEQDRGEEHGERLEGPGVLGYDEGCEEGGGEGVFWE